jgi:serine/threonine protein kinase
MIGTFNFMSPEAIQSEKRVSGETVVKLNYKTDVWSLGCILYNMVYNRMPFGDIKNPCNKIMAIVDKNHKIQFSDTEISGHDPVVNEVLKLCLERNPSERGSIEDLLEHKYLKQQHTSRSNLASQSRLQRTRTPESAQPKQKSVEQMLKEYSTFSPGTKEAFFKRIQNK